MDDENQPPGECPLDITIARDDTLSDVDESRLTKAILTVLEKHGCKKATLSVALVSDAKIEEINKQYLNHTGPTDVISFDLTDGSGSEIDGELVISVETAKAQSTTRAHSAEIETILYAVHGTLHLLGFDDLNPEEAEQMHSEEDRIMTELGYGIVYGT